MGLCSGYGQVPIECYNFQCLKVAFSFNFWNSYLKAQARNLFIHADKNGLLRLGTGSAILNMQP
jgi:hypothetical protein